MLLLVSGTADHGWSEISPSASPKTPILLDGVERSAIFCLKRAKLV
jgi:hypothetical protein